MRVTAILDNIDNGRLALPQFQRGYVWNGNQVRALMDSMYRRHPVGSLLAWNTKPENNVVRGGQNLAPGAVQLLLDGQQRITSLYGIIRGTPPPFFDGSCKAFTGLHFHLDREEFAFWQPNRMKDDPSWIDVSKVMREGLDDYIRKMQNDPNVGRHIARLNNINEIQNRDLHIEEVTGDDKTVDVVVNIFNRVNSSGTKLSKGDLALAKICGEWPEARDKLKELSRRWNEHGYQLSLDWLLRNVNTIVTGEADFGRLHGQSIEAIKDGVVRAERSIERTLNLIADRLGLDHDRVLFGKNALPIIAHYIDRRGGDMDRVEQDRLLYWYFQSAMWGRFSGSTETLIDQDLRLLKSLDGGIDRLIDGLRLWRGSLRIEPGHFVGSNRGNRFYPVLYAMTRIGEAQDWGSGDVLRKSLLGKMSALEMHHIFPKALLHDSCNRSEINAIANYCFLTKETNIRIGAQPPSEYLPEIKAKYPRALESQWIPMDVELWKVENYPQFLEARRRLLANAANQMLEMLGHEETLVPVEKNAEPIARISPDGMKIEDENDEEVVLSELNAWVSAQDLPEGHYEYEIAHSKTGESLALLDLAWPDGLQLEYSEPVALILDERPATLQIANDHGFRHFTGVEAFKRYVIVEVLGLQDEAHISDPLKMGNYRVIPVGKENSSDEVTRFLRGVLNAVKSRLPNELRPNKNSKHACQHSPEESRGRYFRIWYSDPPWKNHQLCYSLELTPPIAGGNQWVVQVVFLHREDPGQVSVKGHLQSVRGLARALTQSRSIQELGLKQSTENKYKRISSTRYESKQLDDAFAETLTNTLQSMIQAITPIVNEFEDERDEK